MLARLKRFSFISIPNDRQFVKRVSEKNSDGFSDFAGNLQLAGRKNVFSRNLGGRATWRRSCGSAELLAGTLRCLRLCWRLPWDWSDEEQLGRCPKPHKRQTKRDEVPPLDPSARLSWSRFHAPSACSFWCFAEAFVCSPKLSVKNQKIPRIVRDSGGTMLTALRCGRGCG